MTEVEKKNAVKPGCQVGCWCVSKVDESKFANKSTHTCDKDQKQLLPLDTAKCAFKIGHRKYYFLKKTKENELVSCETWKIPKNSTQTSERCSICLENYACKDKVMKLSCEHIFHKPCLLKWLQREKRCPLCQAEVQLTIYGEKKEEKLDYDALSFYSTHPSPSSLFYSSGYTSYMF
eukprot:TCONS_00051698-protein